MLNPLQERFRLSELAGRQARISRNVDVGVLNRFSALCDCPDAVRVRLDFRFDRHGVVRMDGDVTARVVVECHRCLEPVPVDLASGFSVAIAASETQATRLGAERDVLRIDGDEAGLAELVEDELILALPERPCPHADCPRSPRLASPADGSSEGAPATTKPFAALGAWRPAARPGRQPR
ncbi:MAG: YceD family protein [Gammaproteobacteria bacterium]|nr:YceD family protein [Gammaproteobacteria bacterium]